MPASRRLPTPPLPGLGSDDAGALARTLVEQRSAVCGHGHADPAFSLLTVVDGGARPAGRWQVSDRDILRGDAALARQVVERLLSGVAPEDTAGGLIGVWERGGDLEPRTTDARWWSALRSVSPTLPALLVVTRYGWRCWPDGPQRTWSRIRQPRR